MKKLLILMVVAVLSGSCSVYQKYSRPQSISTEGLYGEGVPAADTVTVADVCWRDFFTDTHLQRLIEQGLANNADMQIAAQRIVESEAALRTARLSFYPSFAFEPSFSTTNRFGKASTSSHSYTIPVAASWEIDVAGRLLNSKRKAESVYEQSKLYRRSVQTNLIASIANCYYTLLMLDAQLHVSRTTAASWKENVRIMKAMKQAGMTNEASVSQTEANSCSIDASLFDLEYDIIQVENTLALLLGTTPQHFERGDIYNQSVRRDMMIGVPMQLLSRRPDVQSAERALEQAFYNTNLARAAFYPSLSIGADFGWTEQLGAMISSPGAWLVSAVAKLAAPIFNAGRNRANLKIAKAQQEEALIAFRQTLLQAGSEVNDALAQCRAARNKTDIRQRQIAALESAVNSTRQLMSHSESTYLEVLTAQQALLSAQLSQIADRFAAIQGSINLYHALGGGAEEPEVASDESGEEDAKGAKKAKRSRKK
ncbi:MAG: efflux transporter outer membrane subunit [Alistipes sp.]|nr:efflux transporter outer membrane subunit [Alistipes sp.]